MRSKLISLEDARNLIAKDNNDEGRGRRVSPSAVMKVAMERDLTQRQRDCVRMYFFEGMTMQRIGEELGVGKSTVYRHLQKAIARLRKAFEYANAIVGSMDEEEY